MLHNVHTACRICTARPSLQPATRPRALRRHRIANARSVPAPRWTGRQSAVEYHQCSRAPRTNLDPRCGGIDALAAAISATDTVYLDSESNSMLPTANVSRLLQLNVADQIWLVDTLALEPGPEPLAPLAPLLADPDRLVVLHGGEYDVACLKRDYAIAPAVVFDTQQAASLLGYERTGYGALADVVCGVSLPKAHSQYDWGTRPIDDDALRYAIDDVVYLPEIHRAMAAAVIEADLQEEVDIANRVVADADAHQPGYDPAHIYRLKGLQDLPNRCMG